MMDTQCHADETRQRSKNDKNAISLNTKHKAPASFADEALLRSVQNWVSDQFDLPPTDRLPRVQFAPAEKLFQLRYGALLSSASARNETVAGSPSASPRDTLAIYLDSDQTIYLANGWTGATHADISVLVHEMVHHLQNRAKLGHECPQEREKLAYAAQERWLGLFGRSLALDFQLDGLSLLVKTGCLH